MKPFLTRIRLRSEKTLLASTVMLFAGVFAFPASSAARTSVGVDLGFELPRGHVRVSVGSERYYEHRGVFYQRGPRGYKVVSAPRGAYVRHLPPYYTRLYVRGVVYYRSGAVYYRAERDGYVIVDAPVEEAKAPPLRAPEAYQSVWLEDTEYLFKNGQFFRRTSDGLVWVEAPLGALTKELPTDAVGIWYEDVEYFECDEVYFRKTPEGYKVVPAPWTAK